MRIATVLCPVDRSPLADRCVALAASVCERFHARLVLEHNLDTAPPSSLGVSWMWSRVHRDETTARDREAQRWLRARLDSLPPGIVGEARLTRGPLDEALLHLARALPADLILMGSHGWSGPDHRSLTERIIRLSRCSVLAVDENAVRDITFLCAPGGKPTGDARIAVPVDFSAASLGVAECAAGIARQCGIGIDLLCAMNRGRGTPRAMAHLRGRMNRPIGGDAEVPVRFHALACDPLEGCLDFCRQKAATVVMAPSRPSWLCSLGGGGLPRALLHLSPAPVWFVPAAVWRRPAAQAA